MTHARSAGFLVLTARCGELEAGYAFGVVRQLLEQPVLRAAPDRRATLLAGAAVHAEPVLVDAQAGAQPDGGTMYAALHGLFWLVANLAEEQPLLIAVDDMHWIDEASLRWIDYLCRRILSVPVLLVMTARLGGPGPVRTLLASPGVEDIRLVPLGAPAVGELLRDRVANADEALVAACLAASGGNPFLVTELARELSERGTGDLAGFAPLSVTENLRARVHSLPAPAEAIVTALAVLGRTPPMAHVAALTGSPPDAVARGAAALVAADVLADADALEFRHPLLRSAAEAMLSAPGRAAAHARAARLAGDPAAAAVHLMRAHATGDGWTVATLREAAADAMRRGAPDASIRLLRRALDEPPDAPALPAVLCELAIAELIVQEPTMTERLADALAAARDVGSRVVLTRLLASAHLFASHFAEAVHVLDRTLAGLPADESELRLILEADRLFFAFVLPGDFDAGGLDRSLRARMDARSPEADTAGCRAALGVLATRTWLAAQPVERAVPLARRAYGEGRLLREAQPETPTFVLPMLAMTVAGHYEEALRWFAEALEDTRARSSVFGFVHLSGWRAECAYRMGDLRLAESDARAMLAVEEALPVELRRIAAAGLVAALVERGPPRRRRRRAGRPRADR